VPAFDVAHDLADQLDWHWNYHLRPRLDGLTDAEYFWEPVDGCWSIRLSGNRFVQEGKPMRVAERAPFTTIAWRLAHVAGGVLGWRVAAHFERSASTQAEYLSTVEWPGTADDALAFLDDQYGRWQSGVSSLDAPAFDAPCGAAEGPFADAPFGALVLHINREVIHHGAEILTLRDLYAAQ